MRGGRARSLFVIAGLDTIDIVVLLVYLVGTTALGVWVGRGAKSMSEFFMPRKFGITMMMMTAFGSGTASDQAVGVASATFRSGISGIWYQWLWLVATPFYWLIAPILRRLRAVTTADAYKARYDASVAMLFSVVGVVSTTVKIGVMLKGTGALIESVTGSTVDPTWAICGMAVLFLLYGVAGGLTAAIVTDFIHGILTMVYSFMLLPFVLYAVGGLSGVKNTITDPKMLELITEGSKISVFFVVMMGIQSLVGILGQPYIMGVCAAGKTELEGRVGFMCGNFIKRVCTVSWTVTGIAAVAWYMQNGRDLSAINPDNVYGEMARVFLPDAMPGLLGLFLASMMAGVMSSCDNFMLAAASLFTQNIYKQVTPDKSESHYLWVGRAVSVIVVVGGITFAWTIPNVIKALEVWFMIAPMMGIPFWIGLFWRRMTVAGAWASTLTGFGIWWLTSRVWFVDAVAGTSIANSLGLIWVEGGKTSIYMPWQILTYLSLASLVGIVVSLLTKPVPREKLDVFYALTRTPVKIGEQVLEPCTLPVGAEPPSRRMLITAYGLEIPAPSRMSVIGFSAGWAFTVMLVVGFVLLFR
ncbi:MAG: sodium:solute symporter family protein [Candidatus Hydrogenedentes bacterium]|nr:sodium:solute symporter family protein [Candidatus Hydrogenedentota bacterium]